jgi:two-component system chemotaxis response regulator CheY
MSTHSAKVLLVDDEAYFRRFVGGVLRANGHRDIVESSNGREALQIFQVARPRFVIMDINMPHMDGQEALRGLRQLDPDVPIIMLTSVADEMVVEKCIEDGASFFIRKDVPADELTRELGRVLTEFEAGSALSA